MPIDSILFLYFALPAAILFFALTPVKLRPAVLLLFSWGYYYLLERWNLLLMVGVLLFDYVMAWLLLKSPGYPRLRRLVVFCSIAKTIVLFILFSVWQQVDERHFPLGFGVFALISTGYVLDYYHGQTSFEKNPIHFFAMASFFPSLYAGPLVQHARIAPQLRNLRFSLVRMGEGGGIFLCGLAKKLLLGDPILKMLIQLRLVPYQQISVLGAWTMVVTLFFSLYFILSGYCDMARGLGMIFGLELPENYFYPCRAKSVNEFLARFNATVSRFLRRHVYLSLGGSQGSPVSSCFNILLVSILMGLWFGVRLNFILWGMALSFFVLVEKFLLPKGWNSVSAFFRWVYCAFAVLFSMSFFLGDSASQSFRYLGAMVGLNTTTALDNATLYLLASNHMTLLLAAVLATGLPRDIGRGIKARIPHFYESICIVGSGFLFIGITAILV